MNPMNPINPINPVNPTNRSPEQPGPPGASVPSVPSVPPVPPVPSVPSEDSPRDRLARRIGWDVGDAALLHQSLAHRSWCAENPGTSSNERLEFLGDAVLGLVVTVHLYRTYPAMPEGELAKVRASVVNSSSLAEIASELGIGEALLLGKGEDQSGGREKPSILADATEAVIGALYLDRGWEAAERLVMSLVEDRIELGAAGPGGHDYKTRLQELCARAFDQLPVYSVRDEGPDHAKEFEAIVHVSGEAQGTGRGRSKKQAEQAAARQAWEKLRGAERDTVAQEGS
jgi:ribonuclease-3